MLQLSFFFILLFDILDCNKIGILADGNHSWVTGFQNQILRNDTYIIVVQFSSNPVAPIQSACQLLEENVMAVVALYHDSKAVTSIAEILGSVGIPLVLIGNRDVSILRLKSIVFMTPSDHRRAEALTELINHLKWRKMHFVMEYDQKYIQAFQVLEDNSIVYKWTIAGKWKISKNDSEKVIEKQLSDIKKSAIKIVVLYSSEMLVERFFNLVEKLDMNDGGLFHFPATLNRFDKKFKRIITIDNWFGDKRMIESRLRARGLVGFRQDEQNEEALHLLDALVFLEKVSFDVEMVPDCLHANHKNKLKSNLMTLQHTVAMGTMGNLLRFSGQLEIIDFNFAILNFFDNVVEPAAYYSSLSGLKFPTTKTYLKFVDDKYSIPDSVTPLFGQHLRVVTIESRGFSSLINPVENKSNIQPYEIEGHAIDLLRELSRNLGFTYSLYLVRDGKFGLKNVTTGHWNGMIGELINGNCDLVVASLTINSKRSVAVDFTVPYVYNGWQIIMKKNNDQFNLLRIFEPFSKEIWILIILMWIIVSIQICFYERLSPLGTHGDFVQTYHNIELANRSWRTSRKFNKARKYAMEHLSFLNSIWFGWASLLQQGYQFLPSAASAWWMAVTTFSATYTARLGAHLISDRLVKQIDSLADLVAQEEVKFGYPGDGIADDFFCNSNSEQLKKVCSKINSWSSNGFTRPDAGIEKVRNSSYAFIYDSTVLESYAASAPCDLRLVGSVFARQGFGIAMNKNSPFEEVLSQQILSLKSQGFLKESYDRWFVKTGECGVSSREGRSERIRFGFRDLLGVFYIVLGSILVAIVILVIEWLHTVRVAVQYQKPQTIAESIRYRVARVERDFYLNYVPDKTKQTFGLDIYTARMQRILRSISVELATMQGVQKGKYLRQQRVC